MINVLHFVGFRWDEYHRAIRVFGPPDLVHRQNDRRLWSDVAPGDTVVFANGAEDRPAHPQHSFDDSRHF